MEFFIRDTTIEKLREAVAQDMERRAKSFEAARWRMTTKKGAATQKALAEEFRIAAQFWREVKFI